jgi:hypothetical protein
VIRQVARAVGFPLADAAGIYLGLLLLKRLWSAYHFGDPDYFPAYIDYVHFPAYTLLWVGSLYLGGGYDRPYAYGRLLRILGGASILLLAVYGLLPETLRPSRALLLLGAVWAMGWTLAVRIGVHLLRYGTVTESEDRRLLIVGSPDESQRALSLLQRVGARRNFIGRVEARTCVPAPPSDAIGSAERLPELVRLYRAEELLFCSADLDNARIQWWMLEMGPRLEYRILPEASGSIIGSHRPDRRATLYTLDVNLRLDDPTQRRGKWLLDRGLAVLFLFISPVLIWWVADKVGFFRNCLAVLFGRRNWVGYHPGDPERGLLPPTKAGVLYPGMDGELPPETLRHLNLLYARDYGVGEDLRIIRDHLSRLGAGSPR